MKNPSISDPNVEYIKFRGRLYAIIVKNAFRSKSVAFFTQPDYFQQLGYLPHKKGDVITPHLHKRSNRKVLLTDEVLFIKKGKVKINFYDREKKFLSSKIVKTGDTLFLCGGGHGFKVLEDSVLIEVKQGPYLGVDDKERFKGVER